MPPTIVQVPASDNHKRKFDNGAALFAAACESGLEGVIAKRRSAPYRPGERSWIKVKNRAYWRYGEQIESLRKSIERRQAR